MAYLSFEQLDSTSFRISVMSLRTNVGKTIYLFDFDKNNSVVRESVPLDAAFPYYYWDINDVSPNATYNVRVTILYDDGDIQTLEESYTISAGSTSSAELSFPDTPSELITPTQCLVKISNMRSGTKWITVSFDNIAKISRAEESVIQTTYVINELSPNTTYSVRIVIDYSDGEREYLTGTYTTLSGGGSSPDDVWTVRNWGTMYNLSSLDSVRNTLNAGDVALVKFSCANSGIVTLNSAGGVDVVGYLCENTSSFDTTSGEPTSQLVYSDNDGVGNNFKITYEVVAGQEYYLWVRGLSSSYSGAVTVNIYPPEGSSSDDEWSVSQDGIYNDISSRQTLNIDIKAGVVTRIAFSCVNSGDITIYSKGDLNVVGYLSGIVSFDSKNGRPSSYLTTDDDSGGNGQFSMTRSVTAETSYYLWVRGIDKTVSGDITIYINPPSGSSTTRPSRFEWDTEKKSGETFNLTASEWKKLLDNIKEVCDYKDLYPPVDSTSDPSAIDSFYYPSKGDEFKASMYNQCIHQFERLGLISYSDYSVKSGDTITVVRINFLRDTINNVE